MGAVSSIGGRLRVPSSVLSGRSDALRAASVARRVDGVESAEVTPSGTLVIYHDPKAVAADILLGLLQTHGWVDAHSRIARGRRANASPSIVLTLVRALVTGVSRS